MEIYTDGSCLMNPGNGGAAYVAVKDGHISYTWSQGFSSTTNNRMELCACIQAISDHQKEHITVVTDSQYVKKGITEWIHTWKKRNWMTAGRTEVKNPDLWRRLDVLNNTGQVRWKWTRGHDGNEYNEKADTLARMAAEDGPYMDSEIVR